MRKTKLKTFDIILSKPNGLFQINLGPVKAVDKWDAERIGRLLCDAMGRPEWKKRISVREV